MARNAIESEFWTSNIAAGSHFVKKKLSIYIYGRQVKKKIKKIKVGYRSEMARNAIEYDFRTSKMAAEKKNLYRSEMARIAMESQFQTYKMQIDLKWPEMRSKVNFGNSKWAPAAIL